MNNSSDDIKLRIEWCQRMRSSAETQDQQEGWRAEEAGLTDAYLGIDRRQITRSCHPSRLARYHLGLEDGRALARLSRLGQPEHSQVGGQLPQSVGARFRSW